jgi:uncharacterized protein (TIGR03435 family)
MMRATLFLAIAIGSVGTIAAQSSRPSFEVASVRPSTVDRVTPSPIETRPGGAVVAVNVSLRRLITFAYALDVNENVEGASKILDDRFNVTAKPAGDVPRARNGELGPINLMMQSLLADRFKLVVRPDTRPQQGYVLSRLREDGTLGPRAKKSDLDCADPATRDRKPTAEAPRSCASTVANNELKMAGHRTADLAQMLSLVMLQPVVDRTGVSGSFEFRMTFDQSEFTPPQLRRGTAEPSSAPSLFKAIQDQLGLKLERQTYPSRTLVVEHVERPSEN